MIKCIFELPNRVLTFAYFKPRARSIELSPRRLSQFLLTCSTDSCGASIGQGQTESLKGRGISLRSGMLGHRAPGDNKRSRGFRSSAAGAPEKYHYWIGASGFKIPFKLPADHSQSFCLAVRLWKLG